MNVSKFLAFHVHELAISSFRLENKDKDARQAEVMWMEPEITYVDLSFALPMIM